jgi:hypothetical protein
MMAKHLLAAVMMLALTEEELRAVLVAHDNVFNDMILEIYNREE